LAGEHNLSEKLACHNEFVTDRDEPLPKSIQDGSKQHLAGTTASGY
jgi:hypothetical protein